MPEAKHRHRRADGQVNFRERRREDSDMIRNIAEFSSESWEAQETSRGGGAAWFGSASCRCRETWFTNTGSAAKRYEDGDQISHFGFQPSNDNEDDDVVAVNEENGGCEWLELDAMQ